MTYIRERDYAKRYTKERNEKIRCSKIGVKLGPEHCKNIGLAALGRIPWNKGLTKKTDDRVKKYSENRIGIKLSPEHRKNLSNALKGRPTWNKGKTSKDDSRILGGKNSPSYGIHKFREKSPGWKGGKTINNGYIMIYKPEHPFCECKGYVREHRLIIEKYIKRFLKPQEITHHLNEIKNDNHPENLIAFITDSVHQRFHHNPDKVKPSEIIFDGRKII